MALQRTSQNIIRDNVLARSEFRRGNVSGKQYDNWSDVHIGWMPPEHVPTDTNGPFYVVKSYETPIAWYHNDMWTVPDVKYSATTTNHQHTVRMAIRTD